MSMQRSMKKLFGDTPVTETATVIRRISATELEVMTLNGIVKTALVERGAFYPKDAGVRMENGKVVGNGGLLSNVQKVRV